VKDTCFTVAGWDDLEGMILQLALLFVYNFVQFQIYTTSIFSFGVDKKDTSCAYLSKHWKS